MPQPDPRPTRTRDMTIAAACGAFVALMVGATYASVPFYDWFCRATGLNGTTQVAKSTPGRTLERKVTVRFDANVGGGLAWKFAPEKNQIEVRLGDVVTMEYVVTNLTARETQAIAAYNVTPLNLGAYFQKINCFCFTDQTLKPGETRTLTVVFYVDPAIDNDPDGQGDLTMTLSYTFYPQREPQRPVAASKRPGEPGQL